MPRRHFLTFVVGEFKIEILAREVLERLPADFEAGNQRCKLTLVDDDRVDRHAGLESDLVKRPQVGRVGDGHRQPVAAFVQRDNAV